MSRRTMPYHRRYHGDALQGYLVLTLEQRGAYTTILDLIYDAGGPIDNNERWLSGALNCSIRKARALISELLTLRKIFINSQGKISNHRCETEIENSLKISRKRAENASKPRGKNDEVSKMRNENNGDAEQKQSISAVIPVPVPYINKLTSVEDEDTGQERLRNSAPLPALTMAMETPNRRLVDALSGRPEGRSDLHALLRGQRDRGNQGRGRRH